MTKKKGNCGREEGNEELGRKEGKKGRKEGGTREVKGEKGGRGVNSEVKRE